MPSKKRRFLFYYVKLKLVKNIKYNFMENNSWRKLESTRTQLNVGENSQIKDVPPIALLEKRERSSKTSELQSVNFNILHNTETRKLLHERTMDLAWIAKREKFGTIFFLDKSARPISWLFREIWKTQFPGQPLPDIRFLAVGRTSVLELLQSGFEDAQEQLPTDFKNAVPTSLMPFDERYGQAIDNIPSKIKEIHHLYAGHLKSEPILVVDDYVSSGTTMMLSLGLLQRAFPHIERINAIHLFHGKESGCIPWLQEQGFSGIMENIDGSVIATRINQVAVEKQRSLFQEDVNRIYRDITKNLTNYRSYLINKIRPVIAQVIRETDFMDHNPRSIYKKILNLIDKITDSTFIFDRQTLLETALRQLHTVEHFEEACSDAISQGSLLYRDYPPLLNERQSVISSESHTDGHDSPIDNAATNTPEYLTGLQLNTLWRLLRLRVPQMPNLFDTIQKLEIYIDTVPDVKILLDRSKKLHKEIKKLGQLGIAEKSIG